MLVSVVGVSMITSCSTNQETILSSPAVGPPTLNYSGSIAFEPTDGVLAADIRIAISDAEKMQVSFILAASLGEAEVSGREVTNVSVVEQQIFGRKVNAYTIDLSPSVDGSSRNLDFAYRGEPIPEQTPLAINAIDQQRIELTADSFWFPLETSYETVIDASLSIEVEGDWVGVAPGALTRTAGGFTLEQKVGGSDIAMALLLNPVIQNVGPYTVYDVRTSIGENIGGVKTALEERSRFLNDLAGPDDALPSAQIMVFDRESIGSSRRTVIALSNPAGSDQVSLTQFICHELAHNWSRANSSTPEQWHNEGLADAIANLALREIFWKRGLRRPPERLPRKPAIG